ncbi:hypothetical protein YC2023_115168 [Brassica napus]
MIDLPKLPSSDSGALTDLRRSPRHWLLHLQDRRRLHKSKIVWFAKFVEHILLFHRCNLGTLRIPSSWNNLRTKMSRSRRKGPKCND